MKISKDMRVKEASNQRDEFIKRANLNYLKRVARIRGLDWDERTVFLTGINSLSTRARQALVRLAAEQWSTSTIWGHGAQRSFVLKDEVNFVSPENFEESEYVYIDVILVSTMQRSRIQGLPNVGKKTLEEIEKWMAFWGLELRP